MSILICAAGLDQDPCVSTVADELEARGQEVVIFETGRFPGEIRLSLAPTGSTHLHLSDSSQSIPFDCVQAVWSRHLDVGLVGLDDLREDHRSAVRVEASHTLHAALGNLDVFQLDRQSALAATPSQAAQLRLAQSYGFDIPQTLISNDPDEVRRWAADLDATILVKMVDSGSVGFDQGNGYEPIYARSLSDSELAQLDGLEWCPMVFQEQIEKRLELRVTVVGSRIFAAAVDSTQSRSGATDWRRDRGLALEFERFDLPEFIEEAVRRLVRRLGLQFSTLDIILTPDNRYVFLEANSVSFYDFVEEATGLPISRAVAELLIEQAA